MHKYNQNHSPNPNPDIRVTLPKFLEIIFKNLEVTSKNHTFTPKTKVGDLEKRSHTLPNSVQECVLVSIGVD